MPNFSFLACLEVAEYFMSGCVGWGGLAVSTMSNPSCIDLELWLGLDNNVFSFGFD